MQNIMSKWISVSSFIVITILSGSYGQSLGLATQANECDKSCSLGTISNTYESSRNKVIATTEILSVMVATTACAGGLVID